MSRPILRVENLGKQYRIGGARTPYRTLRESLTDAARAPLRWLRRRDNPSTDTLWALRDVNLEVRPGEVVGIIGRNGAGKSTLLKVMSRITEPTTGRVELFGRVGSLLDVGTGFHPELTGRENILLNGAILGMSRAETHRKFDEIVAFAGIESFLDTPVKHYSSGMYMRLGFAVAAHLEPEILVVDEVLAVGDAAFQQKCLGKMKDMARSGRTVLFVSHNMQAVTMLCTSAILLHQGQVQLGGTPLQVVEEYLRSGLDEVAEKVWTRDAAPGGADARLDAVRVLDESGQVQADHDITKGILVEIDFRVLRPSTGMLASIHVLNSMGLCLFAIGTNLERAGPAATTSPGLYRTTCRMPANYFNDGKHFVSAWIVRNSNQVVAHAEEIVSFFTHDYGTGRSGYMGKIIGAVRPAFPWDVERLGDVS